MLKYFEIKKGFSYLYKTNRFHVVVRLFSNRSQKTPKCGKNVSDTLGYASCATFLFLPHFGVICDLLLNRRTVTWNLFVQYYTSSSANQIAAFALASFMYSYFMCVYVRVSVCVVFRP